MKKFLIFVVFAVIAFLSYWFFIKPKDVKKEVVEKQQPIKLKTHSDTFNLATQAAIDSYLKMKNSFIEADTAGIKNNARDFLSLISNIPYSEMKSDPGNILEALNVTVADVKANTNSLLQQSDIQAMRKNFSSISDLLYPGFLKMINYEGNNLYIQHCPMAFDDEIGANWINEKDEVLNPYMGKYHPQYKGTMLHCGEVVDSITFQ